MSVKPTVIVLYINNVLSGLSPLLTFPGDYGKLGHGNSQTHKAPKLIEGNLSRKVNIIVQVYFLELQYCLGIEFKLIDKEQYLIIIII